MNIDDLRQRYEDIKPVYEQFAKYVQKVLEEQIRTRQIFCTFESRVKETDSFLKKALAKHYSSPLDEIRDKAGVRIVLTYADSLSEVKQIISKNFCIHSFEDKEIKLGNNQLGYLGIHYEISLSDKLIKDACKDFQEKTCEIQLHTRAQNLWANISHDLLYKPNQSFPVDIQRSLYRLVALVEIFDKEVSSARQFIQEQPVPVESKMLKQLEKHFYSFMPQSFNKELSVEVIEKLLPLFESSELEEFDSLIDCFVNGEREKLYDIFQDYQADSRRNPLLFQPEVFLIFERLEKDPFKLKEIWTQSFPDSLLESLANIWGTSVDLD